MSFITALLMMLIILFILTVNDVMKISQARLIEARKKDHEIRRKISAEYQEVHLQAIKQKLILKNDLPFFNEDEPTLHLYYLNKCDATKQTSSSEGSLGRHQGS